MAAPASAMLQTLLLLLFSVAWAASAGTQGLLAAAASAAVSSLAAASSCQEQSWCLTAPATKRQPNGDENPGCPRWARECPCSCAETLKEVIAKETAERLAQEAEVARLAARDAALTEHLAVSAKGSNSDGSGAETLQGPHAGVAISILVRSQNVPSDVARVEHFRALGRQHAGVVEFLFLSDLEQEEKGELAQRRPIVAPAGYWALTPFLAHWLQLSKLPAPGAQWLVVVEPWTDVDVPRLQALLGFYDSAGKHFLGRGITMRRGVLTLHHEFEDLVFPFVDSGFAFSRGLVDELAPTIDEQVRSQNFFVTWERELAHTVRAAALKPEGDGGHGGHGGNGRGVSMTSLPRHFCDAHGHDGEFSEADFRGDNARCATVARDKCVRFAFSVPSNQRRRRRRRRQ
jgi:hypothetical protein